MLVYYFDENNEIRCCEYGGDSKDKVPSGFWSKLNGIYHASFIQLIKWRLSIERDMLKNRIRYLEESQRLLSEQEKTVQYFQNLLSKYS